MAVKTLRKIYAVDSHTEGNPTRVILGGVKTPPGSTLFERINWLREHDDSLRRMLNHEPRGGGLMCSVLVMEPMQEGSDFSVIIMEQGAYVPMCGHCIIGTATTLVAEGMVNTDGVSVTIKLDTPAGLVEATVKLDAGEPREVTITNVEAFVLMENVSIETPSFGRVSMDIGYGGDFYPIIDADILGLSLSGENEPAIVRAAAEIRQVIQRELVIKHPEHEDINECYQVQFISTETTGAAQIKTTVVAPPAAMDRSPCGTGTSLLTARALSNGWIALNEEYEVEGPLGTSFVGKAVAVDKRDGILYVRPQVTGRAFLTGYHHFVLTPDDPFPMGYQIGPTN